MIFNLFKRQPTNLEQLRDFIDRMAQAPADELGLAVATVEHFANCGWMFGDFYEPATTLKAKPELLMIAVTEVQRLQASNMPMVATGWLVWAHTFRAVHDLGLCPLAKSMWALLIRGAPYAFDQRATLSPLLGFDLRVENPYRVPVGFE